MDTTLSSRPEGGAVEIIGRRSSLFTRVATLFAQELKVPWRLAHVPDMTVLDASVYAGNPALKIPVLRMNGNAVFGTENICRALSARAAEQRPVHVVWTEDLPDSTERNGQELVWHCMSAQVQLVMGTVIGGLPADSPFFLKTRTGMESSMQWLDDNADQIIEALPPARAISLFEATLFCLIEHLAFRPTVPVAQYRKLGEFAGRFAVREAARATSYRFD